MEQQNVRSIPTHFGESELVRPGPKSNPYRREPFEQRLTYRNHLAVPISIGLRNGLKLSLPAEPNLNDHRFLARVELVLSEQVKMDVHRLLSAVDGNSPPELQVMREALQLQLQVNSHGGATIVLDYPLSLEQLQTYGGSVYYSELDIVVSLLAPGSMPPHPHSDEGRRSQTIAGSPVDHGGVGFGYAVEIVDNHGKYGDRFLNIGGNVYKVPTKQDFTRRDGVYIISNYAASGNLTREEPKVTFCAFEQAQETLGLYRTYDDALHLGDISQARKAELLTMEHELVKARGELQQAKAQQEKDQLASKAEIARMEGENERLKARNQLLERDMEVERQKNKDYYDNRSQQRKDTSETLKILPTIILGIGTFIAALVGIFASRGNSGEKSALW